MNPPHLPELPDHPVPLTGDNALRFEAIAGFTQHALDGRCPPQVAGYAIALHLQAMGLIPAPPLPRPARPKVRRRRPRRPPTR